MQSIYHRLLFFQKLTTTSAQCGGNTEKNRYKDVVPYEVRFTVCDFGISFLTFKVSMTNILLFALWNLHDIVIWKSKNIIGYRCFFTTFQPSENVRFHFQLGQKP